MPEGITIDATTGAVTITAATYASWRVRYEAIRTDRRTLAEQTGTHECAGIEGDWQDTEDEIIHLADDMFAQLAAAEQAGQERPVRILTEVLQLFRLTRTEAAEIPTGAIEIVVSASDVRLAREIAAAAAANAADRDVWLDPELSSATAIGVTHDRPARVLTGAPQ